MTYYFYCDIILWQQKANALVAQPDRVFGYEPKGRGFESLPARQKDKPVFLRRGLSFFLIKNI